MEKYIEGNKAAWEEAFDKRDDSWGADITERIKNIANAIEKDPETMKLVKQIWSMGF